MPATPKVVEAACALAPMVLTERHGGQKERDAQQIGAEGDSMANCSVNLAGGKENEHGEPRLASAKEPGRRIAENGKTLCRGDDTVTFSCSDDESNGESSRYQGQPKEVDPTTGVF